MVRSQRGPVVVGMDIADLAARDPDAVVVELVTQPETDRVVLVEADRDDQAASSDHPDRLVECRAAPVHSNATGHPRHRGVA